VASVWEDYTGRGVTIANIEGQVDYRHPDLAANYDTTLDWDFVENDSDSYVRLPTSDGHSTATSGFMVADDNGSGLVGVAYDSKLFIPAVGANGSSYSHLYDEAINYSWQKGADVANFIGIYLAQSGVPSNIDANAIKASLANAATYGRGGLGMAVAITGGNEYYQGYDTGYWTPTSTRHTASIAALDTYGAPTGWTTPGAGILVATPGERALTLDVSGPYGYSAEDVKVFSGTCGATPLATGVMALMLDANPGLGYRDVYEILAYSARRTEGDPLQWSTNAAGNWNGGGLHVSHRVGYGLIDAHAAVRMAETWERQSTAANEVTLTAASAPRKAIPDNGVLTDSVVVADSVEIDRVEVELNISHPWVGDLKVTLVGPDGTESVLVNRPGKNPDDPGATGAGSSNFVYTVGSTHHYGEASGGTWTLRVEDQHGGHVGTLNSWKLNLYGDAATADDVFVFTNEYIDMGGDANAARRVLSDEGGSDTLNASAVSYDTYLDLSGTAASTIAKNDLSIAQGTVIEKAYTGDGADVVIGNAADNMLSGGRGADTLYGGAGSDRLLGGKGDDLLNGGAGADVLDGGEGFDTVSYLGASQGVAVDLGAARGTGGEAAGDSLVGIEAVEGSAFADTLAGGAGGDVLE
ncbi:MAG TPA: S8 family serine peptidase, partial [Candidatus Omnitrophota bacterium]|nr:S8 family serine peptidase [Candidatus Omnitrophota bacterium]